MALLLIGLLVVVVLWACYLLDNGTTRYVYFVVALLHVLAEGHHVLIHWTASGTHSERLATLTGETIPPTRRRVRVSGALLTEVRDGKILREWTYWDQLSLLAQLGITDQPGLFLSPEGF